MALQLYKIATVEVGSAGTSSMDFTSIPQGYTDLCLKISARSNRTGDPSDGCFLKLNGVTTNQTARYLYGNGSTATSSTDTKVWGITNAASATANTFGNTEFYIPNYTSSNYKSISSDGVAENNATLGYDGIAASLWSSTAAINAVSVYPAVGTLWLEYSTATLYGIL